MDPVRRQAPTAVANLIHPDKTDTTILRILTLLETTMISTSMAGKTMVRRAIHETPMARSIVPAVSTIKFGQRS
ncbi:hypothetical protein ColTof4_10706 [Colletotrichum tofieldiae]|nr:hypothetical protein ColTof3_06824 [Colletotrichum tofieldiae]GKT78283.1 hypothetical protein ColTof4_10706 [Colletotrichum tofieldiae]GKT85646.1 hypothetical protein Ct61P_03496 [Colletotrichum tofieldiae]